MGWFKKKSPVVLDLDEAAFERWLRAHRPPFEWFLGLPGPEQEALAQLGDAYAADVMIATGYAIRDPDAANAGLTAETDVDAEAALVQKIAAAAVQKMVKAEPEKTPEPEALTMGGVIERRKQAEKAREEKRNQSKVFLGRRPSS